jgi:hypothetical protein
VISAWLAPPGWGSPIGVSGTWGVRWRGTDRSGSSKVMGKGSQEGRSGGSWLPKVKSHKIFITRVGVALTATPSGWGRDLWDSHSLWAAGHWQSIKPVTMSGLQY